MPDGPGRSIDLWYRAEGSGPVVLLLHGLGGDHTVWNGIIPELARTFQVLAPDLRGNGRSPAPPGEPLGLDELEADVLALLGRAGVAKAHLVGLSAGGFLALRIALDHPERVSSLTLIGSGVYCNNHTKAIGERWSETFRTEGFDGVMLRMMKDLYYPDWVEGHLDLLDRARESLRGRDVSAVVRWGIATREFDERTRIAKLRAPTLVIHGMDDQVVDVSHARLLRQSIQGAEVRLLARTGHLVPVERPEETATAIRGFIDRIESARASSTGAAGSTGAGARTV